MNTKIVIVGAGIIGLTVARELLNKQSCEIIIIEKEPQLGLHSSGRNSGVLHAGIYYLKDSLKAKFCLEGNLLMQQYCQQHKLPINHCGKVIVTRNANELETLGILYQRAIDNKARVEIIDEKQLSDIEPNAKTTEKALYSHYTAVVDPKTILQSLYQELLQSQKVRFHFNCRFVKCLDSNTILTSQGKILFDYLINAAGSYADKVAHSFGIAQQYSLLPFKGIYKKLKSDCAHLVNGNIYPVPNLSNPFLGVHFTKNIAGEVYVGPTAIPALGRENYGLFSGIDADIGKVMWQSTKLFFSNPKFRHVAFSEPKKYYSRYFYNDAKKLVKQLQPEWLQSTQKVGIRPQLVDWQNKQLIMDFLVINHDNSLHILNAISPAFTSSLAFAKHIVSNYFIGD